MNAKRDEIEKFLDKELLPQVKEEFAKYRGTEIEDKKKELSRLEATLRDSGMNPDEAPKIMVLREEVVKYGDDEALANEVFSHLSVFLGVITTMVIFSPGAGIKTPTPFPTKARK